ncbi:MAG TPA: hypothetical protein PLS53_08980 [Thermoanaerobaculaceae bacterium]|nr:hypothetical protein [Thermoanaerobaculaceae bacterium]
MSIDQHLRMQRILWAAFVLSLVVYAGLVLGLPAPAETADDRHAPLLWALGLVAAINLLTVMPVLKLMLARLGAVTPGTEMKTALRAHQVAFVVALARVEVVGVLGLVLFVVSSRLDWFGLFLGAAGLGMLILYPRRGQIENLLQPQHAQAPIGPA